MKFREARAACIRHALAREWPPKSNVAIRSALFVAVAIAGFVGAAVHLSAPVLGVGLCALLVGLASWPREADYDAWIAPAGGRRPVADGHDSARGAAAIRASADVADELRAALRARSAVKLTTYDGRRFGYSGVSEVDPEGKWVILATPVTFGDVTTRTRVETDNVATVSVARIAWP